MNTVLTVLHVVAAVFLAGPMAIIPMMGMRTLRTGTSGQVQALAKSVSLYSLLSLIVVFFGFGVLGTAAKSDDFSFSTPWIWISIILYIVALVVNLALVVPAMHKAAIHLPALPASAQPAGPGAAKAEAKPEGYSLVAMGSGISALLLVVIVVLMVWQP